MKHRFNLSRHAIIDPNATDQRPNKQINDSIVNSNIVTRLVSEDTERIEFLPSEFKPVNVNQKTKVELQMPFSPSFNDLNKKQPNHEKYKKQLKPSSISQTQHRDRKIHLSFDQIQDQKSKIKKIEAFRPKSSQNDLRCELSEGSD